MSSTAPAATPKAIFPPLLTWKDPVKTGKVFGAIVAALVVLKSVNLLNLFFRLGSYVLISSAVAEYAGKFITGTGLVTRFRPAYSSCASSQGVKRLNALSQSLPALEEAIQKLVYAANIENTLKAGALFYILFKITAWLSLYKLIFAATISSFSLPAIYEQNQVQINAALSEYSALAREKAGEYSKTAQEKAAPYVKQVDEKLGPISSFIKQKYQVRTASTTVAAAADSIPEPTPAATTSGSKLTSETVESVKATNPFETTVEFPSVPETKPLVDQVKEAAEQVDTNDLKNKTAATNF
jgi:hypothetical protein